MKNRQQIQQCELGGKKGVNRVEIGLDWKKGTSCVENAINEKEKRWKRGLEQSAAYQWAQGVKQKGKSNESKSELSFFKN